MHLGLLKSPESARQKKTSALIREFSVASRKKWNYLRLVNSFMRWIVFYLLHLIDAILACSNSLQNVNRDNIDFILDSISSSHSVVPNQMERIIWFVFYHLAKTWAFKGWNLTIMIIDLILLSKSICAMIFRSPKILKKSIVFFRAERIEQIFVHEWHILRFPCLLVFLLHQKWNEICVHWNRIIHLSDICSNTVRSPLIRKGHATKC